jgi:hypothetical protein
MREFISPYYEGKVCVCCKPKLEKAADIERDRIIRIIASVMTYKELDLMSHLIDKIEALPEGEAQ